MQQRHAIIAHQGAGSLTAQQYSIKAIQHLCTQNFPCIELDVFESDDPNIDDKEFIVSHALQGTIQEYLPEYRPAKNKVLSTTFRNGFVATTNQAINYNEPVPALREALNVICNSNCAIMMELKRGDTDRLIHVLEEYDDIKQCVILTSFNLLKNKAYRQAGFRNMLLCNSVPESLDQIDDVCCSATNAHLFQQSSKIQRFFVYGIYGPEQFQQLKVACPKLAGCYTDAPLPVFRPTVSSNLSLMDPRNHYVCSQGPADVLAMYTRMEMVQGRPQITFLPDTPSVVVGYNFPNYAFSMDATQGPSQHIFQCRLNPNDDPSGRMSMYFAFENQWIRDHSSETFSLMSVYMRGDGMLVFYHVRNDDGRQVIGHHADSTGLMGMLDQPFYIRWESLVDPTRPNSPNGCPVRLYECVVGLNNDDTLRYGRFIVDASNTYPITVRTWNNHN